MRATARKLASGLSLENAAATQKDYVLVALLEAGGAEQFVDIEDIAVTAHRLAPSLFCWRRYPELPSAESTRLALRDAERLHGQLFVRSDGGRSRRFSGAGLAMATSAKTRLGIGGDETALRRPANRELHRLERHPAFKLWSEGGIATVGREDLADLLFCSPGSPSAVFADRLHAAGAAAGHWQRRELEAFLQDALAHLDEILSRRGE